MIEIDGVVAPGFENVADAFERSALPGGGSALSIRVGGTTVVDIWQGNADEATGVPWHEDTPSVLFSCTKGLLAILVAQLVEGGRIELDAPVATYWPEFAAAGKAEITVRQVLSHRAGLAAPRDDIDLATALDWDAIVSILAAQEPLWTPGAAYGYHALTYGWLVGEIVRRVTGQSVKARFAQVLADPLGADAWIGLPAQLEPRVARLYAGASLTEQPTVEGPNLDPEHARWMERAMTLGSAFPSALVVPGQGFDSPMVHQAEIPGAGGIASASGLATIWSATVVETAGVRLVGDDVIADMSQVRSEDEPIWWLPGPYPRWGSGFMLTSERRSFLGARSFGHDGAGGQVAFADPEFKVGFGFVTNHFEVHSDDRAESIVRALRAVLHDR